MNEDKGNPFEENQNLHLVKRFEKMLSEGKVSFFDVEEFEEILEYYSLIHQPKDALRVVEHARSQHPGSLALSFKEAEILAINNKIDEALELLKKVELVESQNPDLFLTRANIYSQQGRFNKAIQNLKQALAFETEETDNIYLSLAFEYQNLDKFEIAIKYLKEALDKNSNNTDALYELAFCYEQANDNNSAIEYYKTFIDEHPYATHAWYNLGNCYSNVEDFDRALEAFDYAGIIEPEFSSSFFNKANILARLNRYNEAIEVYNIRKRA